MELLKRTYETFLSAPTLSQLEYLDISDLACMESLFEIIFTSPFYSNLKELICTCYNMNGIKMNEELIVSCTNWINLRKIFGSSVKASRNCLLALQNNPIFKNNLKSVSFNEFNEQFQDLMSYWESELFE